MKMSLEPPLLSASYTADSRTNFPVVLPSSGISLLVAQGTELKQEVSQSENFSYAVLMKPDNILTFQEFFNSQTFTIISCLKFKNTNLL